jgi:hypothetical protein
VLPMVQGGAGDAQEQGSASAALAAWLCGGGEVAYGRTNAAAAAQTRMHTCGIQPQECESSRTITAGGATCDRVPGS